MSDPGAEVSHLARVVYLGLGANVGDRLINLRTALRRLAAEGTISAVSDLYETAPSGVTDQPPFLNVACAFDTQLSLRAVLLLAKRIEWELGRRPARVWGPRPADIDLLLAGTATVDELDLIVPHPRLHQRGFVLAPLGDVAAEVRHPTLGQTVATLWKNLPPDEKATIERLAGQGWWDLSNLPPRDAGAIPGSG